MIKFATFLLAFTTMSPLVSASPLPAETDYVDFNKPFTVNITALCDDSCLDSHEKDWRITGEIPGSGGVMRVTTYSDYLEPKRPEDPEGPEDPEDSVPYRKVGEVRFDNATDVEDRVFFVDRDLNASEKDDIAIGKTVVDNRHWKCNVTIEEDGILGVSNFKYEQLPTLDLGNILKEVEGKVNMEIVQYQCIKDWVP